MKPLPLLITLVALALLGGGALLISRKDQKPEASLPYEGVPQAPLPSNFEDDPPPIPSPPVLTEDVVPEQKMISFVENYLDLKFTEPPIFTPVPAETMIIAVENGITHSFQQKRLTDLELLTKSLNILPDFQELKETLILILAGEMRGLVTPKHNFISNEFASDSPPEQAALINLLAQRLLLQKFPFPPSSSSIDEMMANHFIIQTLALATENEFRKTLPTYPPSLNENVRQSILLGLPSFFHELSTFSEFHLVSQLATLSPKDAIARYSDPSSTPSRALLSFPFAIDQEENAATTLGSIPLYLLLLEASDPTTARTLATDLIGDQTSAESGNASWTLQFASSQAPPRVAECLRSYYSLRDSERKIGIEVQEQKVIIKAKDKGKSPSLPTGLIPVFDLQSPSRPLN